MGRSGGRSGYKVFSINTTVRNPKRNIDFLEVFEDYDGLAFNNETKEKYLIDLVRKGIYKFSNVPEAVKNKLMIGEELTDTEVREAIVNNPQKTGLPGRVTTQLRSLKDQGFLKFEGKGKNPRYSMTKLAKDLLRNQYSTTDVYTKSMLGLHAHNPGRLKMLNQARPFLNTLFVIHELERYYRSINIEFKGILRHEFGAFVLSMKDCNYKKVVNEIITYRSKYGLQPDEDYICDYLFNKIKLIDISYKSVISEYPDDVFRKFEMTGLINTRGQFKYIYYEFSKYNRKKIDSIITEYKNYNFITFGSLDEYVSYLESISLPWEVDKEIRTQIINEKAKELRIELKSLENNLDSIEQELDRHFYSKILSDIIIKTEYNRIREELLILSGTSYENSKYDDLPEPLRLEFMIALLLGKKYGSNGLVSNIIFSEDGQPISFAPSGKIDILYYTDDTSLIIEPTMLRNRMQQLNSETTNIARHIIDESEKTGKKYFSIMIAPYVHRDVARYFKFETKESNVAMAPITISYFLSLVDNSPDIISFTKEVEGVINLLIDKENQEYLDYINQH